MPSSIRRIDVAGRDITEYMQLLLRKSGYVFHTSAEKEVVRMIKEKMSFVALDPRKEEKEWATNMGRAESKMVEYVLPDGNKLKACRARRSFPRANSLPCSTDWSRTVPSPRNPLRPRDHRPRVSRNPPNRGRCH